MVSTLSQSIKLEFFIKKSEVAFWTQNSGYMIMKTESFESFWEGMEDVFAMIICHFA